MRPVCLALEVLAWILVNAIIKIANKDDTRSPEAVNSDSVVQTPQHCLLCTCHHNSELAKKLQEFVDK